MEKTLCYPCWYCGKVLNRLVLWRKHMHIHENLPRDVKKWGNDIPIPNNPNGETCDVKATGCTIIEILKIYSNQSATYYYPYDA